MQAQVLSSLEAVEVEVGLNHRVQMGLQVDVVRELDDPCGHHCLVLEALEVEVVLNHRVQMGLRGVVVMHVLLLLCGLLLLHLAFEQEMNPGVLRHNDQMSLYQHCR
jgi:hypothetical protein